MAEGTAGGRAVIEKADWNDAYQELMRGAQPGDAAPLTREEEDADWAKVQARLAVREGSVAPPAPSLRAVGSPSRHLERLAWAAALAAVVLGGLSLRLWSEVRRLSQELGSPRVLERHVLLPDGVRGARQPAIVLPAAPDVLVLAPSLLDQPDYPAYRLDLSQAAGGTTRTIWSAPGLERRSDDTVEIWVPRAFLRSGPHQLRIYGRGADGDKLLATYTVEIPG
jgi:hypothetical protein